jgi:hypothetical protein
MTLALKFRTIKKSEDSPQIFDRTCWKNFEIFWKTEICKIPTKFGDFSAQIGTKLAKFRWFFLINMSDKLGKIIKNCDYNLLNCWGRRGAQECKSCRSRQGLSNEYLLAKIGFGTAENEPFNFHNFSSLQGFNFHRAVVSLIMRRLSGLRIPVLTPQGISALGSFVGQPLFIFIFAALRNGSASVIFARITVPTVMLAVVFSQCCFCWRTHFLDSSSHFSWLAAPFRVFYSAATNLDWVLPW